MHQNLVTCQYLRMLEPKVMPPGLNSMTSWTMNVMLGLKTDYDMTMDPQYVRPMDGLICPYVMVSTVSEILFCFQYKNNCACVLFFQKFGLPRNIFKDQHKNHNGPSDLTTWRKGCFQH